MLVINTLEQLGLQWWLIVLDDLQAMSFINRHLEEDAPVAVYYNLTVMGTSLYSVFDAIELWVEAWFHDL